MVECLLSMQEVLGSIPRFCNTFLYCSECRLNSKVYYQWPLSLSDATFFGVSVNVGKKNFGKQLTICQFFPTKIFLCTVFSSSLA